MMILEGFQDRRAVGWGALLQRGGVHHVIRTQDDRDIGLPEQAAMQAAYETLPVGPLLGKV